MACINDRPNCGAAADVDLEAVEDVFKWIVILFGGAGALASLVGFLGLIDLVGGTVSIGPLVLSAGGAGMLLGFVVAATLVTIISLSANDRCTASTSSPECLAGVVVAVEDSFSSNWDEVLPWRAMHDRVDLVIKSDYWQVIESGNAYVYCTGEVTENRRTSEIASCYFFDQRVCDAAMGAIRGAIIGGIVGIIAAAIIVAAMCATIFLCILGLFLAAIVAGAAVLGGAAIGGQIAKANSTDEDPTTNTGETIAIGHLVTTHGPMERRGYDNGANVLYWVDSAQFHGVSMSPQPFSYCEINDELSMDGCNVLPVVE